MAPNAVGQVLVETRCVGLQRTFRIDHGGQRLVLDGHECRRVFGHVSVLCDHDGDGLADKPDAVDRDREVPDVGSTFSGNGSYQSVTSAPVRTEITPGT